MSKSKHPGLFVKALLFDKFNLSVTDAAKILRVGRQGLSEIINGSRAISPAMAVRLEEVFNINAKKLFFLQCEYDFDIASRKKYNLQRIGKKRVKVPAKID